jgi:membrane associated rhomboid family serine protease
MFIPLSAGRREYTGFPAATAIIVAVNLLVYAVEAYLYLGRGPEVWYEALKVWGFVPASVVAQEGLRGLTAFTSMYLHGDPAHIIFNMLYLWVFGPQVEDLTGSLQFFLFYTLCGLGGCALTLLFDAGSTLPHVGASGAIAGVMGSFLFLHPGQRVRTLVFLIIPLFPQLPAWVLLAWWVVEQAAVGQFVATVGVNETGIGVWAHIGGFALGLLAIFLFLRKDVIYNRESVFKLRRGRRA